MSKDKSYKAYQQGFSAIKALKAHLFVIKGGSEFLSLLTRRQLQAAWTEDGWECERIEGANLNAEKFLQFTMARSLFEPKSLTLVSDAFQAADLLEALKGLSSLKEIRNPVGLLQAGEVPAKFQKELDRLNVPVLSCDNPAPWEFADFINDRGKGLGLKLQPDAVALLLDAVGNDLFRLDNELRRLSLSLGSEAISAGTLRPMLGMVREDHAFLIDQHLCKEAYGKAILLLKDLMDRGESALAVLALLAMHCRKALQIQSGLRLGHTPADLARDLRMPPKAVQAYLPYVAKRAPAQFTRVLNLCHQADRKLKSRGFGDEIWLDQIVWELIPASALGSESRV